jgi:hypothetical protein
MIKLIAVESKEDFKLLLRFSDGCWGVYDFSHLVATGTAMTAPLRDPAFFKQHFIELGALAWPNGFDLSAGSLYRKLESAAGLHRDSKVA